jgi:hypothetical protein
LSTTQKYFKVFVILVWGATQERAEKSMAESIDNLVLEILRRLQSDMADLKAGQRDIQYRLTLIEARLAGVERNLADHYAAYAGQSARLDRFEDRMERLERRLELRDTP